MNLLKNIYHISLIAFRFRRKIPYTLSLILAISLLSCTDDLGFKPEATPDLSEGFLTVHFEMPEPDHIITRSLDSDPERKINNLAILIFDSDHNLMIRKDLNDVEIANAQAGFDSESRSYTYQVAIDDEDDKALQNVGQLFAVANYVQNGKDLLAGFNEVANPKKKYEEFLNITSTVDNTEGGGFMMSGLMLKDEKLLKLTRTSAKISIQDDFDSDTFEMDSYGIYDVSESSYMMAEVRKYFDDTYPENPMHWYCNSINSTDQTVSGTKNVGVSGNANAPSLQYKEKEFCYVNPTKTHEDLKVYTYVVIYANYMGKNYYYAVPLYKKGENGEDDSYYDIEPNHWYDMRIVKVLKEGDDDPLTAIANHNNNQIWVEIHDHAPVIYSMISDGIHELGVTRALSITNENPSVELSVKCFAADLDNIDDKDVDLVYDDWLEVKYKESTTYQKTGGEEPDLDNPGKVITYIVNVKDGFTVYSEETGTIKVKWKGLEREVAVSYDPGFKIADVLSVSLNIKPDGGDTNNKLIENYWTFVTGNGEAKSETSTGTAANKTPKLYGIKASDLVNSKVRTGGFHFPMPYGTNFDTTPWEYEYTLDFSHQTKTTLDGSTLNEDVSDKISSIIITPSADMESKVKWTPDPTYKTKGKLTWSGDKKSYVYDGGTIKFEIIYEDGTPKTEFTLSVYHTGFFHYDGNNKYCPEDDFGYYYYEVVPMGSGYWLDRNIGAKGSMRFIDTEDESYEIGNRNYAGRLYTIATPESFVGATLDMGMCPPGYHIPNQGEWDDIRLTSNFTAQTVSDGNSVFISTYYNTGNTRIGNVYFQKARFYNESNVATLYPDVRYTMEPNVGDAGGGYYWTTTAAPAMEKEQMGNWFRALYLIGSSAAYNNASITDHRMAVRCRAGNTVAEAKEYYVSFNAHNITHVFLFDKASKTPLYAFPGKALGTAASASKWQYFYCSTTEPIEELLVLFTKVDTDGKVYLYTKSGESFTTDVKYSTDILDDRHAWTVQRGKYYDFCDTAHEREGSNVTDEQPDECDAAGSSSGSVKFEPEYDTEKIDWTGVYEATWSEKMTQYNGANKFTNWPVGTIMKVYYIPGEGSSNLQVCNSDPWRTIKDENSSHQSIKDGSIRVINIELTQELLDEINKHGIQFQGSNAVMIAVTFIQGDGTSGGGDNQGSGNEGGGNQGGADNPTPPDLKDGDFEWNDSQTVNWSAVDIGLTTDKYDWSQVKAGSQLYLYYTAGDQPQIYIRCKDKDGDGDTIPGIEWRYSIWETLPNPIHVTLTQDAIDMIRQYGGLIFKGGNYTITKVVLTLAK